MNRRINAVWMRDAAMVLVFALAGLLLGLAYGRHTQRRLGHAELDRYAGRLLAENRVLAFEAKNAADTVSHDGLDLCSGQELNLMRQLAFRAPDIQYIGHLRGGRLYCSTAVGVLARPLVTHPPDLATPDGVQVRASVPLFVSPGTRGLVIDMEDVSVVFNPDFYTHWDEPPMFYGTVIYVLRSRQMVHALGHPMPLSYDETLAGRFVRRNGILYKPVCDSRPDACIIVAEPEAAMMARNHLFVPYFVITGGVLGGLLGLTVALVLETQRSLARQLRRAVRRGTVFLEYQPIVDLRSGQVVSAEALARWTRNGDDIVPPELFIGLAEQRGFLRDLTRLVITRAVNELGPLLASGNFSVSINVSSEDLVDPAFVEHLETTLRAAHLPTSAVGLELTERSTAHHAAATQAISRLKAKGHTVAIDDFGTGYSSLSYLHELAVDAIKIDRSFTRTIGTEAVTASVVPQILAMAAQLQLVVVAEGIETVEQAAYFAAAPVDVLGQGYFFGTPMTADALRDRIGAGFHQNATGD